MQKILPISFNFFFFPFYKSFYFVKYSLFILRFYFPQKLRKISRKLWAWAESCHAPNVQIRARGHFLPQFVKHNSNNNNEVWFYKERGRLDMLVWFLAREAGYGAGWTSDRWKSWAKIESADWFTLLSEAFSLADSSHCSKLRRSHCETQYWVSPKQGNNR